MASSSSCATQVTASTPVMVTRGDARAPPASTAESVNVSSAGIECTSNVTSPSKSSSAHWGLGKEKGKELRRGMFFYSPGGTARLPLQRKAGSVERRAPAVRVVFNFWAPSLNRTPPAPAAADPPPRGARVA